MRSIYTSLAALLLLAGCGTPAVPSVPGSPQASAAATASPTAAASAAPSAAPSPTVVPTAAATAAPTPTSVSLPTAIVTPTFVPPAEGTITIDEPVAGARITSPVTVKGATDFWPFEATLTGQIKDAAGNVLGIGPVMIQSEEIGRGGPFEAQISFTPPAESQAGTLELFEASAKDGSIVVIQTVPVQLTGTN